MFCSTAGFGTHWPLHLISSRNNHIPIFLCFAFCLLPYFTWRNFIHSPSLFPGGNLSQYSWNWLRHFPMCFWYSCNHVACRAEMWHVYFVSFHSAQGLSHNMGFLTPIITVSEQELTTAVGSWGEAWIETESFCRGTNQKQLIIFAITLFVSAWNLWHAVSTNGPEIVSTQIPPFSFCLPMSTSPPASSGPKSQKGARVPRSICVWSQ